MLGVLLWVDRDRTLSAPGQCAVVSVQRCHSTVQTSHLSVHLCDVCHSVTHWDKKYILLMDVLQEEWKLISLDFINGLVSSMPKRAEAVYRAKGGPTKY